MIWSLIKIVLFFLAVAAVSLLAIWLLDQGGPLRAEIFGVEVVTTSGAAIAILILLVIPVVWTTLFLLRLLWAAVRFATGDQTALTRVISKSRERRGFDALADSMVALASGEHRMAAEKISTAALHLNRPELTGLIAAQAEERLGHPDIAQKIYRDLLVNPSTRFSGLIGILKHQLEEGDVDSVLKLARKAAELRPRHSEVQKILQSVQCRTGDWPGARQTLKARFRYNHLPRKDFERAEAVMAMAEALGLEAEGHTRDALQAVNRALKLQPGLVPAATLAARLQGETVSRRAVERLLARAWTLNPHPELAEAFARLVPDETPEERYNRFSKLTGKRPDHPETRMAMAELAIARRDHDTAAAVIDALDTSDRTARSLIIQAAIERLRGSPDSVIQTLLGQAVAAPRGAQWLCSACHHSATAWQPLCGNCQGFDTLVWQTTPTTGQGDALLADMVPRILPAPAAMADLAAASPAAAEGT